jgi:hypothetical protein
VGWCQWSTKAGCGRRRASSLRLAATVTVPDSDGLEPKAMPGPARQSRCAALTDVTDLGRRRRGRLAEPGPGTEPGAHQSE